MYVQKYVRKILVTNYKGQSDKSANISAKLRDILNTCMSRSRETIAVQIVKRSSDIISNNIISLKDQNIEAMLKKSVKTLDFKLFPNSQRHNMVPKFTKNCRGACITLPLCHIWRQWALHLVQTNSSIKCVNYS